MILSIDGLSMVGLTRREVKRKVYQVGLPGGILVVSNQYGKGAIEKMGRKRKRSLRRRSRKNTQSYKDFVQNHYEFWLAHGANYLCSPLREGIWKPVCNVYHFSKIWTKQEVITEVKAHFKTPDNRIPEDAYPALNWAQQTPRFVFDVYRELRGEVKEENLTLPHHPPVWEHFDRLKKASL